MLTFKSKIRSGFSSKTFLGKLGGSTGYKLQILYTWNYRQTYKAILTKRNRHSSNCSNGNCDHVSDIKSKDLIPVSKEGNPPPKDGNPLKAEKNDPVPRFLLPRGPLRLPKKSSNGSSKNKQIQFVKSLFQLTFSWESCDKGNWVNTSCYSIRRKNLSTSCNKAYLQRNQSSSNNQQLSLLV